MRLNRCRPLLVYAVGMISVVKDDDENEGEGSQQRQRAFPGCKHGGMRDGRDRRQTSESVHARRVEGQKHQVTMAKERRRQGRDSSMAVLGVALEAGSCGRPKGSATFIMARRRRTRAVTDRDATGRLAHLYQLCQATFN